MICTPNGSPISELKDIPNSWPIYLLGPSGVSSVHSAMEPPWMWGKAEKPAGIMKASWFMKNRRQVFLILNLESSMIKNSGGPRPPEGDQVDPGVALGDGVKDVQRRLAAGGFTPYRVGHHPRRLRRAPL